MNVGEIQRKLSLKAERSPAHQFDDLYSLLYHPDWLRLAHDYVCQNQGSHTAGCDGITMQVFDKKLEVNLQNLIKELKSGQFEPAPVRRVYIPKSNGKARPLGIASIKDRIVQEALRMVLEPIYEADFSQYSFGFRPNRCTMDAIKCITWSTQERKKYFWVIEGDISSYFSTIHHRKLMKILKHRIRDCRILNLIWKFLRSGVMENKIFHDIHIGVPQGGIVSPLLANVYLHELDKFMKNRYTGLSQAEKTKRRRGKKANFVYVRYADDWVVLSNGTKAQAQVAKQELQQFLRDKLRLKLSDEKTKITHLNDGFEFLGFRLRRSMGHKGMATKVTIPKSAVAKVVAKIKAITNPSTHRHSINAKVQALNQVIGGWCRYYQYTTQATKTFSTIGTHAFWAMAHWLGRKFKISMPKVMRRFYEDGTFTTNNYRLKPAYKYANSIYKKRFLKPNPYTTQEQVIYREKLSNACFWTGCESRPGMMDLRPLILKRDKGICQMCGRKVTPSNAEIDHKRPVRRFKLPINANHEDNLWTLCIECHLKKTKSAQRRESRMP